MCYVRTISGTCVLRTAFPGRIEDHRTAWLYPFDKTTMALLDYANFQLIEYLDGSYFNKVLMREFPGQVVKDPVTIRLDHAGLEDPTGTISPYIRMARELTQPCVVRLIIESVGDGRVLSRHSNLLIVQGDTISRFEPMEENSSLISPFIGQETGMRVLDIIEHPQDAESSHCVSYSLMYAYFFLHGRKPDFSRGILGFELAVKGMYSPPCNCQPPDIEFGLDKKTGTITGGLIGGGAGLLVGGVPGLLIGAGGGALLGNVLSDDGDKQPAQSQ